MNDKNLIRFAKISIQTPRVSGQENFFIQKICHEMQNLGFDRVFVDKVGNAIGEINGSKSGKTILLDAHADTVGVQAEGWSVDPFAGEIINNHLYGRGAADTKGNLAAIIYGTAKVDRSKINGFIIVSATVSEEVMEGGSNRSVFAEATELYLNRGGRDRAEIVIETIGKSAHSSSPEV